MEMEKDLRDPGSWIEDIIRDFIATSPFNTMKNEAGNRAWDNALVGFASGADQIWQQYKEYVGAFHWTPWEVFTQHCLNNPATPEELTVISWVLPQREMVRKASRRSRKYPSEEWARIRIYGEEANVELRRHIVRCLKENGHEAGATREELIEAASVGLLMGGSLAMGPIVTLFVDTINLLAPESGK
jgi:epoxyqueuosine reductase